MADWRDLAARAFVGDPADACAEPSAAVPFADEVKRLQALRAPRGLANASAWHRVIADAGRLVRSGWAERALALGWSGHDLFGVGRAGTDEFEGLAAWLAGRKLAAVTQWQARTLCGGIFYREAFMRPNSPKLDPVYLWQFGKPE